MGPERFREANPEGGHQAELSGALAWTTAGATLVPLCALPSARPLQESSFSGFWTSTLVEAVRRAAACRFYEVSSMEAVCSGAGTVGVRFPGGAVCGPSCRVSLPDAARARKGFCRFSPVRLERTLN